VAACVNQRPDLYCCGLAQVWALCGARARRRPPQPMRRPAPLLASFEAVEPPLCTSPPTPNTTPTRPGQVGVMDMLRFHKFTIGHAWITGEGALPRQRSPAAQRAAQAPGLRTAAGARAARGA
jgi:hypothetical protein